MLVPLPVLGTLTRGNRIDDVHLQVAELFDLRTEEVTSLGLDQDHRQHPAGGRSWDELLARAAARLCNASTHSDR